MLLNALTFELRIMLRKRRMKIEEHKSGIKKRLTVILPAQEAKGGQPLAPILGQVQIPTGNFISVFNELSSDYPNGFPLPVEILVYWEKSEKETKYKINILQLPFSYFVNFYSYLIPEFDSHKYIYIADVFRLVDIFKLLYNTKNYNDFMVFSQILSILRSHDVNVSLHSERIILNLLTTFYKNYSGVFLLCRRLYSLFDPMLENPKYKKRTVKLKKSKKKEVKKKKKRRRYGVS